MNRSITTIACIFFALLLCSGCDTLRVSTPDNARDSFADARNTWTIGESSYDEMVQKYGQPANKTDVEGGFTVRWLARRTVTRTNTPYGNSNPVINFETELNKPMSVMTVTTALDAFYTPYGILKDYRIQVIE